MGNEYAFDFGYEDEREDGQLELFDLGELGWKSASLYDLLREKSRKAKERPLRYPRRILAPPGDYVPIYDKTALFAELDRAAALSGTAETDESDSPYEKLSFEETGRATALEALARDQRGPWRAKLMVKDHNLIERLRAISAAAPHFKVVIDVIIRAATLALMTGTELRLPPILLLGPPGIGKSWLSKQLAGALGTSTHQIAGNAITDAALLLGHPTSWKGAKPGLIGEILTKSNTASPVILFDELDKLKTHYSEDPFNVLLTLLERENASRAMDEYLMVPFDMSRIIWILTANDLGRIPAPVFDRLLVFVIGPPGRKGRRDLVRGMAKQALARFEAPGFSITESAVKKLADHTPRHVTKLIDLALGFAAEAGRFELTAKDIANALALFGKSEAPPPAAEPEEEPIKMGFLPTLMAVGKEVGTAS